MAPLRRRTDGGLAADQAEDLDRARDVLQRLRSAALDSDRDLVAHLVRGGARYVDPAGLRQGLDPRRDVDAVAVDVVSIDDDVADIDPDTELDPPFGRAVGSVLGHQLLDFHGAGHGVDGASELDQRAVAHQLDHPARMTRHLRVDDCVAQRFEAGERSAFVGFHQTRIADDIESKYGGKPALNPLASHGGKASRLSSEPADMPAAHCGPDRLAWLLRRHSCGGRHRHLIARLRRACPLRPGRFAGIGKASSGPGLYLRRVARAAARR